MTCPAGFPLALGRHELVPPDPKMAPDLLTELVAAILLQVERFVAQRHRKREHATHLLDIVQGPRHQRSLAEVECSSGSYLLAPPLDSGMVDGPKPRSV